MGWNYTDWNGSFYPKQTAMRDTLGVYSRAFDAVEIDSTFYGTPRVPQVQRWYQTTPAHFLFCPKVPRLLTHDMGLRDIEVPLRNFFETLAHLKEKRGAILFQMPPSFGRENLDALEELLPRLDSLRTGEEQFAFEFRNRTLIGSEVSEMLRTYSVARVAADYVGMPRRFEITADFVYMRLIGRHGDFEQHKTTQRDRASEIDTWAKVLIANQEAYQRAFVFCNNDYEGYSPATCNRLQERLGLQSKPAPQEIQGSLF